MASLLLLLFHSCQPATVPVNIKKMPVVIKDKLQLGKELFETLSFPFKPGFFSGFLYHNRSSQSRENSCFSLQLEWMPTISHNEYDEGRRGWSILSIPRGTLRTSASYCSSSINNCDELKNHTRALLLYIWRDNALKKTMLKTIPLWVLVSGLLLAKQTTKLIRAKVCSDEGLRLKTLNLINLSDTKV